jgi:hypothetical protein
VLCANLLKNAPIIATDDHQVWIKSRLIKAVWGVRFGIPTMGIACTGRIPQKGIALVMLRVLMDISSG